MEPPLQAESMDAARMAVSVAARAAARVAARLAGILFGLGLCKVGDSGFGAMCEMYAMHVVVVVRTILGCRECLVFAAGVGVCGTPYRGAR